MPDLTGFRRERIEKLLHELRYEVERGIMEREIDETMGFQFHVPISDVIPGGVVFCEFCTRPMPSYFGMVEPRLKLVKSGEK